MFKIVIIGILLIVAGFFIFNNPDDSLEHNSASIANGTNDILEKKVVEEDFSSKNINPITGVECDNHNRRPLAVMMANDPVARPLSGISKADLIIEMPVITGSITRTMAFFVCEEPEEIGSLRSARHDFIPLAMGFDSVFVHWGGSNFALDKLDRGIMDNVNALYNPFGTFYRKSGLPRPHNGFTSYRRIWTAVKKLGYRQDIDFEAYTFENKDECEVCKKGELAVGYAAPYNVYYEYDFARNVYLRFRYGYPELNRPDNSQAEFKNVIIMRALSRQINRDYNDVDVEGGGKLIFYKNGKEIFGRWEKDKAIQSSKLYFFNEDGEKIKFVPGKTIIEIVEPRQKVEYEPQNL